jgi:sugar transferase (PEP-CTERM/EpsH1 system associated)
MPYMDATGRSKVLALAFRAPYPLTDGASIRIYNVAKAIAEQHSVDLLFVNEGRVADGVLAKLESVFKRVLPFPHHPWSFKLNAIRGLISRDSLQPHYHYFAEVQNWVDQHVREYDLILCFHIRMSRYLREVHGIPKILDLIDATSINYREAVSHASGIWKAIYSIENRRLLTYELDMLSSFDTKFITSPYDKSYLEGHLGHSADRLIVVPNGVKEELLTRTDCNVETNSLVFLGKMNYAPNVDAVKYFASRVFPLIKRQVPGVRFVIVGISPAQDVKRLGSLDGIDVTGYVDDPYEYIARSKVVVAPLRFGAGIQNKVLEAMALGKPVVATPNAVRGIAGKSGEHFVVANDSVIMANEIVALLLDDAKRKRLGRSARHLVAEVYRWDNIRGLVLREVNALLASRKETEQAEEG